MTRSDARRRVARNFTISLPAHLADDETFVELCSVTADTLGLRFRDMRVRLAAKPSSSRQLAIVTLRQGLGLGATVTLTRQGGSVGVEVSATSRIETLLVVFGLLLAIPGGFGTALVIIAAFPFRYLWLPPILGVGAGLAILVLVYMVGMLPFRNVNKVAESEALADRLAGLIEHAFRQ